MRKVLGDGIADRLDDVWDLDAEGELNGVCSFLTFFIDLVYSKLIMQMWRPSGHPGFWYMGGNLAICRIYSKFLALQIKAIEAGLVEKPSGAKL